MLAVTFFSKNSAHTVLFLIIRLGDNEHLILGEKHLEPFFVVYSVYFVLLTIFYADHFS